MNDALKALSTYLLFLLFSQNLLAQTDDIKHAISYTKNGVTIRAYTNLLDEKEITPHQDKTYYYLHKGEIHQNQGGYIGQLLDGKTSMTLDNGQLISSGQYKDGVKIGKWTTWNVNGSLSKVTNWKKGKKNGRFFQYDDKGNLTQSGSYKNDQYNGKLKNYQNGSLMLISHYKNGTIKKTVNIQEKRKAKQQKKAEQKKEKEAKKAAKKLKAATEKKKKEADKKPQKKGKKTKG